MPEAQQRTLKVFLASPSDVSEEREALARLVRDINDVLTFLAPERRLTLELVRYETHSYPDAGRPQEVINCQIPVDYDIFIGVMWKRCGTPTASEPSGTIEEYRRACERRQKGHLPRIMFYFCEQPIPIPDQDELEQLSQVLKFRDEIASEGLRWSYPTHAAFSEHVRGGLLRAIRDVLREESIDSRGVPPPAAIAPSPSAQAEVINLAVQYEDLRSNMPSGTARTSRMTDVFSAMKAKAPAVSSLLAEFEKSSSAGQRLVGIAILQMFPQSDHLEWLSERLDPKQEKPFIGFQAALALLEAVRGLPLSECDRLRASLDKAMSLARRLAGDADRIKVLETARRELSQRCPNSAEA